MSTWWYRGRRCSWSYNRASPPLSLLTPEITTLSLALLGKQVRVSPEVPTVPCRPRMPEGKLTALFGFFFKLCSVIIFLQTLWLFKNWAKNSVELGKWNPRKILLNISKQWVRYIIFFCKILWRKQIYERNRKSTFFLLNFLI